MLLDADCETVADALVIAAGGDYCPDVARLCLGETAVIICADGGIVACRALGLRPDYLIGDLDSAPAPLVDWACDAGAEILRYPAAKDQTDLELAMERAVALGARRLAVTGATGGRIDHTLANIDVLMGFAHRLERIVAVENRGELIFLAGADRVATIRGRAGDTVSLIPGCGDARGVTTTGLHYRLLDEDLRYGTARGVSNYMTEPIAYVKMGSGELLVVHMPS
ncbi:MAG: Thiamine pyrophosphokinase [Firmicutes bacterium ADurb.Bin506]|nr:MAG: Thiamine pyrophosphokinase [Firmicutes bacterium ADurb.Bin506]